MRERGTKQEIEDWKRQFGMWLGLPESAREPKKQEHLAHQLGVSPETLTRWKRDPAVIKAKESAVRMLGGNDMYEVAKTITEKAKEGNFQMARLYMEWQGEIGGRKQEKPEPVEIVIKRGTESRS